VVVETTLLENEYVDDAIVPDCVKVPEVSTENVTGPWLRSVRIRFVKVVTVTVTVMRLPEGAGVGLVIAGNLTSIDVPEVMAWKLLTLITGVEPGINVQTIPPEIAARPEPIWQGILEIDVRPVPRSLVIPEKANSIIPFVELALVWTAAEGIAEVGVKEILKVVVFPSPTHEEIAVEAENNGATVVNGTDQVSMTVVPSVWYEVTSKSEVELSEEAVMMLLSLK